MSQMRGGQAAGRAGGRSAGRRSGRQIARRGAVRARQGTAFGSGATEYANAARYSEQAANTSGPGRDGGKAARPDAGSAGTGGKTTADPAGSRGQASSGGTI